MSISELARLKELLTEATHMRVAVELLEWDQEVHVPPKGHEARAATKALVARICHEKKTSPEIGELVHKLEGRADLSLPELCIVRKAGYDFAKATRLPKELVQETTRVCSEAHSHWVQAKQGSDFNMFAPDLKKIVELKRQEAECVGYEDSPYDSLLDDFEPGATSAQFTPIFDDLKKFLVPFVAQIGASPVKPDKCILAKNCPIRMQEEFTRMVVSQMGFDWNAGILAVTAHPQCYSFHPGDIRMSTRYKEDNFFAQCFFSTVHEAGHGLYDQGLPAEYFGTPAGEYVSMAIHESQSRMWENQVGHSKAFWRYFYPRLKGAFGFQDQFWGVPFDAFYAAINSVEPSLIRTDADEVTYNLHVIMRFEIEKALIEGDLEVSDLPDAWNAKVWEYLGIMVPGHAEGVLQDIHWPAGLFGYFPTYTLGNMYAAQFYGAIKREVPDIEKRHAAGDFSALLGWNRRNIHAHGRIYTAGELVEMATGEQLTSRYLTDYLQEKYSEIYQL